MRAARSWFGFLGTPALVVLPALVSAQPVGSEFQINTYTTGSQFFASIAADANGDFVVVWESISAQDGSGRGVFGQRFDSTGAALGGEFQVNSYTTLDQRDASVASDANGNFVVVWESLPNQDGNGRGVFGQRYDSAGAPLGSEFRVNSYTTSSQDAPSVASDASGNFVVVWRSLGQDGSSDGVFGQRFDSAGNRLGTEFQVNSHTSFLQQESSVASDASGNFVVVWQSFGQIGNHWAVLGQRYDSQGTPQGSEFVVSPPGYGSVSAAVASHSSGSFVVVYGGSRPGGGPLGFLGQRYDSGGVALGSEFLVSRCRNFGGPPSVATDADGNFLVAWQCEDQNGSGIFGRRYDSQGRPRPVFQINSYTTGSQANASIAATDVSQFAVTWDSSDQDGSASGVFGQLYDFLAMHVGDLDGRAKDVAASWRAQVTTRVHKDAHSPLAGALVTLDVSGVGARTCTTVTSGSCEVSVIVSDSVPSLTFTVTNLSKAGFTYAPAANHDPDGDSDGTVIVVNQP